MRHRPGITLLEVLVAIFIMAIGMLALLTLFPLGALNMARALRDDRAAQAAANAENIALAQDLRHDTTVSALFNSQPGWPVFVDPFGAPYSSSIGARAGAT